MRRYPSESQSRTFICASIVAALAVGLTGCGGPFNVKPRAAVPPVTTMPEGRAGSLAVSAEPVTDEDFLYNAFNADLIMAGILPVWVKVANGGEAAIDLKKSEWSLSSQNGPYRRLEPAKAYKRLVSFYQIKAYSKAGYQQSRGDFDSTALDLTVPAAAGATREGYLFFSVPAELARKNEFKLLIRKIGQPPGANDQSIQIDLESSQTGAVPNRP